ncbi:MAG: hypothetical protein GXP31_12085 [Kiritimatiellaeota bacterium]|nr:hypothetical protein [Kiritimatiellota bacterium]
MSIIRNKTGEITFVYPACPGARKVFLAGDFNEWAPAARRMVRVKDGSFRARMRLAPGRYEYKFVVDGKWTADPGAEGLAPNGFGGYNSVVQV